MSHDYSYVLLAQFAALVEEGSGVLDDLLSIYPEAPELLTAKARLEASGSYTKQLMRRF